ncbi:MAG: hypothetical protein KAH91_05040 [Thermoplasmatales archaeon]|nr:hypothetical protein [Thermoplasmatales archaeon]
MEDKRFPLQYINMCKDGQEDIQSIRIMNATEIKAKQINLMANFAFKQDDYFNHPKMGEEEVRKVAQVGKSNIRAVDDPWPYQKDECIWIPTADQLEKEVQELPWALHKDVAKMYYEDQNHELASLSEEEYTLVYYMEKKCGKTWDFEN